MNSTTESVAILQWGIVLVASLVAALWDLKSRRIPNVLTLPLLAAGLVQAAWFDGFDGLKSSLLAAVILGLPYVVLFVFAGGGAGDAKLMAAVGAWLGIENGIVALLAISICAIILALLKAAFQKQFLAVLSRIHAIIITCFLVITSHGLLKASAATEPEQGGPGQMTMPYGPAIFAGLVAAAVYCWLK
ncbi:MAG: A24 family peptidase [Planctomycetota bacterium]|jgi:prepilin peptidase CpaA